MHHTLSLALFVGMAHVLVAVNEAYRSSTLDEPPFGMPVSEAWPDPIWRPVQAMMNTVYRTGEPAALVMPTGLLTIAPHRRDGVIVGWCRCMFGRYGTRLRVKRRTIRCWLLLNRKRRQRPVVVEERRQVIER